MKKVIYNTLSDLEDDKISKPDDEDVFLWVLSVQVI